MPLPKTFQFSATSLQDYVDCSRRFQLRYLLRVAWPAPEVEPIGEQERHTQLARDFHRLVHQHLLGLPVEMLSASVHDVELERWWQAYLAYSPALDNAQILPEVDLSTPLAGHRLAARYDAIVVRDRGYDQNDETGEDVARSRVPLLIVDWKTYRRRPSRAWLAQRLQTRVYPVVLVEAGVSIMRRSSIEPQEVGMCYWMAEFPQDPESFFYNEAIYRADLEYLSLLVTEISERAGADGFSATSTADEIWPLTSDENRCRFCSYRSLCGRGKVPGSVTDYTQDELLGYLTSDEAGLDVDLDWGQVQEIVY